MAATIVGLLLIMINLLLPYHLYHLPLTLKGRLFCMTYVLLRRSQTRRSPTARDHSTRVTCLESKKLPIYGLNRPQSFIHAGC
jgi:hypothetical protein